MRDMRQKPGVPGYVVPEVRDKALETIAPGSLIKASGGYDKEAIAVEKRECRNCIKQP